MSVAAKATDSSMKIELSRGDRLLVTPASSSLQDRPARLLRNGDPPIARAAAPAAGTSALHPSAGLGRLRPAGSASCARRTAERRQERPVQPPYGAVRSRVQLPGDVRRADAWPRHV